MKGSYSEKFTAIQLSATINGLLYSLSCLFLFCFKMLRFLKIIYSIEKNALIICNTYCFFNKTLW